MADADEAAFQASGIYDPDAPNAEDRLATLRYLIELGATMEELVDAARRDRLVPLASQLTLASDELMTIAEASEATGIPVDQISALGRLVGLAPLAPDQPCFSKADIAAFQTVELGSQMFGAEATLHFGRVVGNSMARIAEAALSLFLLGVEGPLHRQHASELELARAQHDGIELLGLIPQLMETLLHAHVVQQIQRDVGDSTGVYDGISTVAVGFVDLVGFTPLTQTLDPSALLKLVTDFEGQAIDIVAAHGGRVVKLIGDEVMFTAQDAVGGCAIALELFDAFRGDSSVQARGGLHIGPTLAWGGDRYGATVNCASRIGELAVPYEMLVTEAVRDAVGPNAGFAFEPAGRRMLRGFPEPVTLFAVSR